MFIKHRSWRTMYRQYFGFWSMFTGITPCEVFSDFCISCIPVIYKEFQLSTTLRMDWLSEIYQLLYEPILHNFVKLPSDTLREKPPQIVFPWLFLQNLVLVHPYTIKWINVPNFSFLRQIVLISITPSPYQSPLDVDISS